VSDSDKDPPEDKRVYYRDARTGDRGWMVTREGKKAIKLDRAMHDVCRTYKESDWILDKETRPITRAQQAQVAFGADVILCRFLGFHALGKRDWNLMKDEERIAWVKKGPSGGVRLQLFEAVMHALRDISA
jgi:hypothetical protein